MSRRGDGAVTDGRAKGERRKARGERREAARRREAIDLELAALTLQEGTGIACVKRNEPPGRTSRKRLAIASNN